MWPEFLIQSNSSIEFQIGEPLAVALCGAPSSYAGGALLLTPVGVSPSICNLRTPTWRHLQAI